MPPQTQAPLLPSHPSPSLRKPFATPEVAGTPSSSKSKAKKKKISGNITYKKGERSRSLDYSPHSHIKHSYQQEVHHQGNLKGQVRHSSYVCLYQWYQEETYEYGFHTLYRQEKTERFQITVSAYDTLGNVKIAQITITDGKVSGVRYY
jgi:hypothetical protein